MVSQPLLLGLELSRASPGPEHVIEQGVPSLKKEREEQL